MNNNNALILYEEYSYCFGKQIKVSNEMNSNLGSSAIVLCMQPNDSVVLFSQLNLPIINKLIAAELCIDQRVITIIPQEKNCDSQEQCYKQIQKLSAVARELFIQVAANKWNICPTDCNIRDGAVYHNSKNYHYRYSELLLNASELTPPQHPPIINQMIN